MIDLVQIKTSDDSKRQFFSLYCFLSNRSKIVVIERTEKGRAQKKNTSVSHQGSTLSEALECSVADVCTYREAPPLFPFLFHRHTLGVRPPPPPPLCNKTREKGNYHHQILLYCISFVQNLCLLIHKSYDYQKVFTECSCDTGLLLNVI